MKKPLLILTGPTAVGKTALSIALARAVNGEIISADSMQVYRGMDIGSAKIRPEEMGGIRHHLIDVLDPSEGFDVVQFQHMAKKAMTSVWSRGKIPIITGGTGFYIQSVLYDIDFSQGSSEETPDDLTYRKKLEAIAQQQGKKSLFQMLKECDPEAAQEIHPNNVKRVIRALEFFHQTGEKISTHNREQKARTSPYNYLYLVLNQEREELYRRIDKRVDQMMEDGLLEEVCALKNAGYDRTFISMQGLGYKEILACLEGEISLDEAVRIIKRDTRHFAKRQLTWFRRERDVIWIDKERFADDTDQILAYILELCRERKII